ncbi:hypothetical protein GY45DRAFT_1338294 [Cubamyces sp. BRFM 1775]|nr:hypothetical protein GY45DRAFT_1338294 [Cubamyces sp. BRFM 1775]
MHDSRHRAQQVSWNELDAFHIVMGATRRLSATVYTLHSWDIQEKFNIVLDGDGGAGIKIMAVKLQLIEPARIYARASRRAIATGYFELLGQPMSAGSLAHPVRAETLPTAKSNWYYFDDTDPRIVYSGGNWTASVNNGPSSVPGVYNKTLHGASKQGLTATLSFTGTAIAVVGASGLTGKYGRPAVNFAIDGVQQQTSLVSPGVTYNFLAPNVTFFSLSVPMGWHILSITNLNGTAPNTFWLDYILLQTSADPNDDPDNSSSVTAGSGTVSSAAARGGRGKRSCWHRDYGHRGTTGNPIHDNIP